MDDVAMEESLKDVWMDFGAGHCRSGDRVALAGYLGSSDTLDVAHRLRRAVPPTRA